MVAAGCGIAPFHGFMQERKLQCDQGTIHMKPFTFLAFTHLHVDHSSHSPRPPQPPCPMRSPRTCSTSGSTTRCAAFFLLMAEIRNDDLIHHWFTFLHIPSVRVEQGLPVRVRVDGLRAGRPAQAAHGVLGGPRPQPAAHFRAAPHDGGHAHAVAAHREGAGQHLRLRVLSLGLQPFFTR